MKSQKVQYIKGDEDSTLTLEILVGETFEDTVVIEKVSIDEKTGEEFTHFTLETPSTEDQVYKTLEELAAETESELAEAQARLESDEALLDDIVVEDPRSDALELQLMGDE